METICGKIHKVIYSNPSNNYTVLDIDANGALISATGIVVSAGEGEFITAQGDWVVHPTYGEQFKISEIVVTAPSDLVSIQAYLSSGMIRGIGQKKAKDLINHFGEETLDIIENAPNRLCEVSGIGNKIAKMIHEDYMTHNEERNVVMSLSKYGLTTNISLKLYKKYGGNAVAVIERNPYKLIEDFYGIGFLKADHIASQVGIEKDSYLRVSACLKHFINLNIQKGYTYVLENYLIVNVAKSLGIDEEVISDTVDNMVQSGRVILEEYKEERRIYQPYMYYNEVECATKLVQILSVREEYENEFDYDELINQYEHYTGVELDVVQKEAVISAVGGKVTLITGGPGTGKTTIIKAIIYILNLMAKKYALAAPTGRAAKRMGEACGEDAKTIHRLLEYSFDFGGEAELDAMSFSKNQDSPLEQDFVIIDEMSMVDISLMNSLLRAVDITSSLVLVGDYNQLPSVGAGCVLSDLVESGVVNVVKLNKIFRQANESQIVTNAHRINNGLYPQIEKGSEDFIFLEVVTQSKIALFLVELIKKKQKLRDMLTNDKLKILSPFKKGDCGIISLNKAIQEIINPKEDGKAETFIPNYTLRVGDKVMQTKNNYSIKYKNLNNYIEGEGIFNGDMGTIQHIDTTSRQALVLFENERVVSYPFSELDNLTLAYAITIHKSQGSEFDSLIIPIYRQNPEFLSRNLIYTAITRAKKQVILIGEQYVLNQMIDNDKVQKRLSGFKEKLIDESSNNSNLGIN